MSRSMGFFIQNYLNNSHRKTGYIILSILLYPLALLYKLIVILRRQSYDTGIFKAAHLNHPVISVGNLTTGGTGKTPFEIYLIGKLQEMNIRPLLLLRGYGSKSSASIALAEQEMGDAEQIPDETRMIAEKFPDIPLAFGKDRIKAYTRACAKSDFDLVILDDGFQHLQIKRDLEIVILDLAQPFGSGKMLPSGNLREPKSVLKYADLIVINQKNYRSPERSPLAELIAAHNPPCGEYHICGIYRLSDGQETALDDLKNAKAGIVSAIADPSGFSESLPNLGLNIIKTFFYRDHHDYTTADLEEIAGQCREAGIEALFTTEKDAVKLRRIRFEKPPLYVIKIEFRLIDGEAVLEKRIRELAQNKNRF